MDVPLSTVRTEPPSTIPHCLSLLPVGGSLRAVWSGASPYPTIVLTWKVGSVAVPHFTQRRL